MLQIRCLVTLWVKSYIISADSNARYNIISNVINVQYEKCKDEEWNLEEVQSLLDAIQNHPKLSITEKKVKEGQIPDTKFHKIWICIN